MVKSLAIELAPAGATANAVVPGYTRKDAGRSGALDPEAWQRAAKANPLQRLAEPDDVAAAAVVFASAYGLHWTARYLAAEQQPPECSEHRGLSA